MLILHLWLSVLCVMPIRCFFDGKCPRKDPPTGVVAITPGSRLVLSCSGHVKVDGVKVVLNSSNKRRPASVRHATTQKGPSNAVVPTKNDQTSLLNPVNERNLSPTAETGVSSEQDKYTVSPLTVHPASMSKMMMDGFDWEDKEMESNDDEVEEGKGSRVTRGVKPRPEWTWNKQLVQKGDTNQGEVTFLNHGTSLSLESVRLTDAGQYTCHHRGTETFTVKLVVADPPETPSLSCYKKSPRSTIHCEWRPRKPITKLPSSYLLLSKGKPDNFHQIPCSYSSQRSLWSCALEQNENELRIPHVASLCVSSFVGNTTSPLFFFKPLDILKPDPPSDVKTHQLEQQEKKIKVTWNLPLTWSKQDNFYDIIYEIRYRPLTSVNNLVCKIKSNRFYIIADALPGVEYLIQLRTKEEYDGLWSEWSSPVYARSWTAESVEGGFPTPTIDLLTLDLGSGLPNDNYPDGDMVEGAVKKTLGIEEKEKKGGVKSWFGGDKEKEKGKGGIFSSGHDEKKKGGDEQKGGGFFSKVFHRDDEDEKDNKQKKSGFQGLFAEGTEGGATGGGDAMGEDAMGGSDVDGGSEGQTLAVTDRDLFDDLIDVASETSKEN